MGVYVGKDIPMDAVRNHLSSVKATIEEKGGCFDAKADNALRVFNETGALDPLRELFSDPEMKQRGERALDAFLALLLLSLSGIVSAVISLAAGIVQAIVMGYLLYLMAIVLVPAFCFRR